MALAKQFRLVPTCERDHSTLGVTGEQDTGFLEGLADSRDVEGERGIDRDIRHQVGCERDPIRDREPPRVRVRWLDAPACEHVSAAHERGRIVAANEKDFEPLTFVSQQHDG